MAMQKKGGSRGKDNLPVRREQNDQKGLTLQVGLKTTGPENVHRLGFEFTWSKTRKDKA